MKVMRYLILVFALFALGSLHAQTKMSRKGELEALKQAYNEAIARTEQLSGELAAQVAAMDSLMGVASQAQELKQENARLKMELKECNEQLREHDAAKSASATAIPVALFFEVGKTSIGAKELVNLTFFVENSLKINPDKVFTVYGIENQFALQRVDYICNILHKRFGIGKERIVNDGVLGKDAYPGINLNRVVIIK